MQFSRGRAVYSFLLLVVALVVAPGLRAAEPLDPKNVPEPLKPWTAWALAGDGSALCPTLNGQKDTVRCVWPSRLELAIDEHGGHFSQKWHVDGTHWVPLPGDDKRWPLDVKVDGASAVVISVASAPSVQLGPGEHVATGSFAWDSPPESLRVPPETGLLALTLRGAPIASPNRDASGSVFLQKTTSAAEGEKLEILVHRKITDEIPLRLTTHLELDVAGKSREVLLGKALPPGFVPMSLDSQLPARLEQDSRLRIQLRPGRFSIELAARSEGLVKSIARPAPDGPWREGEEVWTFEAQPDLRLVDLHGPNSIDPAQTSLPEGWKKFPAYPMKVGDELVFDERRRGDADPPPNQLHLIRSLWLDFDGGGYTISDSLSGTLNRDSRLEMDPPTTLGRVAVGGRDQFITHLGDPTHMGVEVRQGTLDVTADSRLVGNVADIPAVGWKHDFHQVSATLHLPPGWRLFHASGVEEVPATWLHQWSLLELFLVLIAALAVGRLHGWKWGAVAVVMLGLTIPEDGAPKWIWLFVLAAEALVRLVPVGTFQTLARVLRAGMLVVATLIAIPFLVSHVRQGMYPVLAAEDLSVGSGTSLDDVDGRFGNVEGGVGTRAKGEEGQMGQATAMDGEQKVAEDKPVDVLAAPSATATATGTAAANGWFRGSAGKTAPAQFNTEEYDPNAVVQTGPGLPRWRWTNVPLTWSGPVASSQRLSLWLVPPSANFALAFVRFLLLALVLLRMIPQTGRFWPKGWGPPPAAAKAAALVVFTFGAAFATLAAPRTASADIPSKEVLDELRARLLAKPECLPTCASSERLSLEVSGGSLQGRLALDAAAATAVPLPGNASQWLPDDVALDGAPAKALLRTSDGTLWLAVPAGAHQVVFQGKLPERDSVQLALPLKPHRVEATAKGWEIAGVHEDGLADDNLQFTRIAEAGAPSGALQPGALAPFVRVERTITVGLNWQVDTRVVRLTPPGTAVVLEVPLLAGESVTTADVRVVSGKAQVNIAPTQTEASWRSVLEQKSPLALAAPKATAWTEVWRIDVGPIWHATYTGIPSIHVGATGGPRIPEWRPWPGETESIALSRPDGTKGQSLTIDGSTMDVRPGLRATDVVLTLTIRASRGSSHVMTLPDGAELESISINGQSQPVRQDGSKVTLAIVPGAQTVVLTWRQTPPIGLVYRTPSVDLGAPSVNGTVDVEPGSRWVLFLYGPRVGPAVLFWSLLFVLVCVAVALGRIKWTPLRWWHWALLAVGLSQVPIVLGALFAGWLVALGWRKEKQDLSPGLFNARQILLAVWTVIALVLLAVSIHQGLLGTPEMQIRGNASEYGTLHWYQDRSDGVLPTALVISVPMLVYRIAMLAWALWVALALLKWLRWGWAAFSDGGFWKRSPPPVRPMAYAVPQGYAPPPVASPPAPVPEPPPTPVVSPDVEKAPDSDDETKV